MDDTKCIVKILYIVNILIYKLMRIQQIRWRKYKVALYKKISQYYLYLLLVPLLFRKQRSDTHGSHPSVALNT